MMKRWAGLLALFLVAAIGAVMISTRFQPSELERQHATIRVGMTGGEVLEILGTPEPPFLGTSRWVGLTWTYLPPRRFLARQVRLEVEFDTDERVIRTMVDGVQVQPPYKWGNP